MFLRSTTTTTTSIMKQKTGVQMNHNNHNHNNHNHKIPSKRRRFIFILLYTFIIFCFMTGIADLILLIKSILFQQQHQVSYNNNLSNYHHHNQYHTSSRMTKTSHTNYTNDAVSISITTMERSKVAQEKKSQTQREQQSDTTRCAINFFGLPRSFETLVLPSIIKNIIIPNNNCDYYIHYYYMTQELQGRSGNGGTIDPTAILLLKNAVHTISKQRNETIVPIVEFIYDTENDFWNIYNDLIYKIRNTKRNNQYLYFPWKAKTYRHPVTTDNIIKMWHSIQSSYQLMEQFAKIHNIEYKTVAMLRSDVVYVTPLNINNHKDDDLLKELVVKNSNNHNQNNQLPPVIVPNFGKHPVSDRIIYGPKDAVKIWATERFNHLEQHIEYIYNNDPGWGLHSERFVNYTLYPLIQNITSIYLHPTLCFFRARADETVWVSDCYGTSYDIAAPSIMEHLIQQYTTLKNVVQNAIGRVCIGPKPIKLTKTVRSLDCSTSSSTTNKTERKE